MPKFYADFYADFESELINTENLADTELEGG